jgi:hypothetical protein
MYVAAVKVDISTTKKEEEGETISKQAQRILPNRLAVELHKFTSHSLFDCRKSFGFTARRQHHAISGVNPR